MKSVSLSCSHLSVGSPAQKLDSSQITDQRGRFHYRTIFLLYRTNKPLNLSAIICSPSLRRHREASAVTPILPVCLFCAFKWLSAHTAMGANLHLDCSVTAWFSESSTFRNQYSLSGSAWKSIWLPAGSVAPLITLQIRLHCLMRADTEDDVVQTLWKAILHAQTRKEKVHFCLRTSDVKFDSVLLCKLLIQFQLWSWFSFSEILRALNIDSF